MQKLIFLFLMVLAAFNSIFSQQLVQFSQQALLPLSYNAAFAGTREAVEVELLLRRQWVGLSGSPAAEALHFNQPVAILGGGIGARIERVKMGAHQVLMGELDVSKHFKLGAGLFSVGIAGAANQWAMDGTLLRTPQGAYELPSFDHNDPQLNNAIEKGWAPSVQMALWYKSERVEAGVAVRQLLQSTVRYKNNVAPTTLIRTFSGNVMLTFGSEQGLQVKPGLVLKHDLASTQAEILTILSYRQNIFLGAAFRGYSAATSDAAIVYAGWRLGEKTTVMYSFDQSISGLRQVQDGSHELGLRWTIKTLQRGGQLPPRIYNPRNL